MIELRPYQSETIAALYRWFERHDGNPLAVLPTGTGKSVVIAEFCRGAIASWPDTRIMILTHVRELIAQNFAELVGLWPDAPAGIYSAGLNRRDLHSQILFAGIQSIHARAFDVQRCDLALIDEAHLIPRASNTMYRRFLDELRRINPHLKVIGFTATPYRLDSGLLHEGDGAVFDGIAFEYGILEAIESGYLSPVVSKQTDTQLDVSGVAVRGGEFVAAALEAAVDRDPINRAVVAEIVEHGRTRGSWLVFCAGVDHAAHIRDIVREAGYSAETVTGDTPPAERDRLVSAFKAGRIRCLTNANVLTTGFNAPGTDLIAMLRPTKSVGLYVQIVGRGTRLASGKDDCLVLDFAGNVARHGPVDRVSGKRRAAKDAGGEAEDAKAPVKTCPECKSIAHLSVRVCPDCGFEYPAPKPQLSLQASTDAILSTQIQPQWTPVTGVAYARHEKPGRPASMRVTYHCGMQFHSEWICFEHTGYPRQKAYRWWAKRAPGRPVPNTVDDAIAAAPGLPRPSAIIIRRQGQYVEIVGHQFQPEENAA
jgi:DNA repair protein RadD